MGHVPHNFVFIRSLIWDQRPPLIKISKAVPGLQTETKVDVKDAFLSLSRRSSRSSTAAALWRTWTWIPAAPWTKRSGTHSCLSTTSSSVSEHLRFASCSSFFPSSADNASSPLSRLALPGTVVGEKEKTSNTVNVRTRDNKVHGECSVEECIQRLKRLKASRSRNAEEEFWAGEQHQVQLLIRDGKAANVHAASLFLSNKCGISVFCLSSEVDFYDCLV